MRALEHRCAKKGQGYAVPRSAKLPSSSSSEEEEKSVELDRPASASLSASAVGRAGKARGTENGERKHTAWPTADNFALCPRHGRRATPQAGCRKPRTPLKHTERRTQSKVRTLRGSARESSLKACRRHVPVVVRFKAVGNAPIMKQNFYKITASNRFQAVIQFLRKELGWKAGDPLVSTLLAHSSARRA